jgi:transposase-like protein
LIESIEADLRQLLAFFERPEAHRSYVRTSNPIERVFRDLRKRGYGCGAFIDSKSCDRVLFSVYTMLNSLWDERRIWDDRIRAAQS